MASNTAPAAGSAWKHYFLGDTAQAISRENVKLVREAFTAYQGGDPRTGLA